MSPPRSGPCRSPAGTARALILAATRAAAGRGPGAWVFAHRLGAKGFETVAAEDAGAGSFTVARLRSA